MRNQILYGDPLGVSVHSELWNSRSPSDGWWALRQEMPYLWSSFWGRFGYGQVVLPNAVYRGLLIFCTVALAGYLVPRRTGLSLGTSAVMVATVVAFVAWVLYYTLVQPAGARGRFLFPSLPAFALLLMGGLSRISPLRTGWPTSLGTAGVMMGVAAYALVGVLVPAFAPPRRLTSSELEAIPNPLSVGFCSGSRSEEHVARLLGYEVSPAEVTPGDVVEVTLYWEALARTERNHVVFVHLISDTGVMIAQRDTYPGLGRFPTTTWHVGAVFADTYRVHTSDTAYAPDRGFVQVGLYVEDGPRLGTEDGADSVRLTEIAVQARPGPIPNATHVNFEDELALIGYSLDQRTAQPGGKISLTLYWEALSDMEINYEAFVHVLGTDDQIWGTNNSPVTDQAVCTNRWETGVIVKEERDVTVGATTPPGFYDLEVGLRIPDDGRLKVLGEDGGRLGNRTLLTRIRVVGDE